MLEEIRRVVAGTRMYEQREFRPERAIAWGLAGHELFPESPLTSNHLEVAKEAGSAALRPGGDRHCGTAPAPHWARYPASKD